MNSFIEKVSLKDGTSLIANYTSAIIDATLERQWFVRIASIDTAGKEKLSEKSKPFPTLTAVRKTFWGSVDLAFDKPAKAVGNDLLTPAEKAVYA